MKPFLLLGLAAGALACLGLYLSSPHQRLLARAGPARRTRAAAAALLVLAWWALAQELQRLVATYLLLTQGMLLLALLPYLGTWRALRRGAAEERHA
jgi:hypothetical protein